MPRTYGFVLPLLLATGLAILLILLGLLTLGAPGALIARLVAPVVEHLRGLPIGSLLAGDRHWPTALLLSIAGPIALPFGLYGGLRLFSGQLAPAAIVAALSLWAWSIIVLLAASLVPLAAG